MRVNVGGKQFWIEFQYGWRAAERPQPGKYSDEYPLRELTTCLIRDGSAPREVNSPAPIIACGNAVRYYKDRYDRDKGRKQALLDAIDNLDVVLPCEAETASEGSALDWQRRLLFWETYLNRKKATAAGKAA